MKTFAEAVDDVYKTLLWSKYDTINYKKVKELAGISLIFLITGVLYSISFLAIELYSLSIISIVNSFLVLLIPIGIRYFSARIKTIVFYFIGINFLLFNVFGSGNTYSIGILLWISLIVILAFALLTRHLAVVFGAIALVMFVVKQLLVDHLYQLPYFIPKQLIDSPRIIDLATPGFLNLFLVYSFTKFLDKNIQQVTQSQKDLNKLSTDFENSRLAYFRIAEQVSSLMFTHSLDGKVKFVNGSITLRLNLSENQIIGREFSSFLPKHSTFNRDIYFETLIREGHTEGLIAIGESPDINYYSYHSTLLHNESGEPIALLTAEDCTRNEINKKEVARNKEELEATLASLNDTIILVGKTNQISRCWSKHATILQATHFDGKTIEDAFASFLGESYDEFYTTYKNALKCAKQSIVCLPVKSNCDERYFEIRILPIDGIQINIIASIYIADITVKYHADMKSTLRLAKLQRYQSCLSKLSHSDLVSNIHFTESMEIVLKEVAKAMNLQVSRYWEIDSQFEFINCKLMWSAAGQFSEVNKKVSIYESGKQSLGCSGCILVDQNCHLRNEINGYLNRLVQLKAIMDNHKVEAFSDYAEDLKPFNAQSFLITPIFLHGKIFGGLAIDSGDINSTWDEIDISFTESIVTIMSLVIEANNCKIASERAIGYSIQVEDKNKEMAIMMEYLTQAQKRAKESERTKSAFLANMSHEIRTPLNAIMGFSELLENPTLSDKKRMEFSKAIRTRSSDLLTILNNVLDYTKLESGMVSLNEIEGNMGDFIERIIAGMRAETRYLTNKTVTILNANELDGESNFIKADFIRLYQVLTNLVNNALKFTYHGTIQIGCSENQDSYLFFVADTGIGIAKSKLETIFDSFKQADESIHGKFGGSGLGLAICKGNVEMWGGRIWVESELETGSTFYFTLPKKPKR